MEEIKQQVADVSPEERAQRFQYMMLSRLESDCHFYLGHGNRDAEYALYYHNEKKHIREMLKLWDELVVKPQWLSKEEIYELAEKMGVKKDDVQ